MSDLFQQLLTELGKIFDLSLHVDHHHACSIQISPLIVQLQLDSSQEKILLFSKIIELPPGRFRENILLETLKSNALSDPVAGIFGYIASINHLALYQCYPLSILNGERLANFLGGFLEMAIKWHKKIKG